MEPEEVNERAAKLAAQAYLAAIEQGATEATAQGIAGNAHMFWLDVLSKKGEVQIIGLPNLQ